MQNLHDIQVARFVASHILVMDEGEIIDQFSKYQNPRHSLAKQLFRAVLPSHPSKRQKFTYDCSYYHTKGILKIPYLLLCCICIKICITHKKGPLCEAWVLFGVSSVKSNYIN
jgi:ABC-type dipeptide/oligopeptide/nickel transport system ATPase component